MCILCVIQKWSRRIATTLPWLVIPLIGLWALSQLLPPSLRFEVTSPRLACVFVLLVTLFWYEILMPQLSAWRARRSARLREKRRFQTMELQKLRKTATRRCRNCSTPYREQNPGGGRFMCSYCGHVSRRPVLDIPGGVLSCKNVEGIGNSAIVRDFVAKGGKIWNGKVWMERQGCNGSGNGWFCGDWLENGTWSGTTFPGKSSYWGKNGTIFGGGLLGSENRCLREKSYPDVAVFGDRLFGFLLVSIRWLWRRGFRIGSSTDAASSDSESRATSRKGDGGLAFQESKGEKARRKAEEKRQARLEKEMLEEEERKQREEVARLVEERRRLRDEKTAVERVHTRGSTPEKDIEGRREKEIERKRHEKTREKDKFSNTERSNSEGEEVERRCRKETEKKRDFDRKGDNERRDLSKFFMNHSLEGKSADSLKAYGSDMGHGFKGSMSNAGKIGASRYFDRMKGSLLSSSKALGGSALTPFFGRGIQTDPQNFSTKVSKPVIGDQAQTHASEQPKVTSTSVWDGMLRSRLRAKVIDGSSETSPKRSSAYNSASDMQLSEYATGRPSVNGDGKSFSAASQPIMQAETPSGTQMAVPKKSWQHLFTRTKTTSVLPTRNPDLQLNPKHIQVEGGTCHLQGHASPTHPLHSPHSEFLAPLTMPAIPCSSMAGCSMPMPVFETSYCPVVDPLSDNIMERGEAFDAAAYVTDPLSLLGPVSESLDNFSLDIGPGFIADTVPERSLTPKKVSTLGDVVWPSPIECPVPKLSQQGCADEANSGSGQFSGTPKSCNGISDMHDLGTWQMWDTPPIIQEGLGLIGSPAWLLPKLNSIPLNPGILGPPSCPPKISLSQFTTENQLIACSHSPQSFCSSYGPEGGAFDSLGAGLVGEDPWQQKVMFHPLPDGDGQFSQENLESSNKDVSLDTTMRPAGGQEPSPGSCCSRSDWAVHRQMGYGMGQAPQTRAHRGAAPDVQSLWSYK